MIYRVARLNSVGAMAHRSKGFPFGSRAGGNRSPVHGRHRLRCRIAVADRVTTAVPA